jgi:hypothetical protein
MALLDKEKLKAGLAVLNADLEKQGKTLQQVADEQKTAALANMKTLNDDPAYAKLWNEK